MCSAGSLHFNNVQKSRSIEDNEKFSLEPTHTLDERNMQANLLGVALGKLRCIRTIFNLVDVNFNDVTDAVDEYAERLSHLRFEKDHTTCLVGFGAFETQQQT